MTFKAYLQWRDEKTHLYAEVPPPYSEFGRAVRRFVRNPYVRRGNSLWVFHRADASIVREIVRNLYQVFDQLGELPDLDPSVIEGIQSFCSSSFKKSRVELEEGDEWARRQLCVTDEAPIEVINAAYRALSMKFHPDRIGDNSRMRDINRAVQILREAG